MNPNRIDLNLLRVFDAILETRSVTIAASALWLTQSAVSNQRARLRDAFDDPLFVRTSEGMMPAPRALAISDPIRHEIPTFQVKQHWHERFHHDPGNRWLRGLVAELYQDRPSP